MSRPRLASPRVRLAALLGVLSVFAAACSSADAANSDWRPATTPSAIQPPQPDLGGGDGGGSGTSTPPPSSAPASPGSPSTPAIDPNVVATQLTAPTGIAVLPDGTALVGERTTGRLLIVQPDAGQPVAVAKTLTGLDTSGGGGLLDIALSATYNEDGLVLALISTATDIRVVHFTLAGAVTPILTGIPRGATDNVGKLLVLDTGDVLVGTGDAGNAALAVDPASLAGKVLRVNDIGQPQSGNAAPGSPVFTSGHTTVNGLCVDTVTSTLYATQSGATDELNQLAVGKSYAPGATNGQTLPNLGGIGGCAVVDGDLYVTGLGGKDVFQARIDKTGAPSTFTGLLKGRYGRLLNVVAGDDGTLWLTTSNKDGQGSPVADDERVIHIRPEGGGGGSTV